MKIATLHNERGIALFMVLWVVALLSVIVGEFCHSMRAEVNVTRNFKEETEAAFIARAGVNVAVNELLKLERTPFVPKADETPEEKAARWRVNAENPEIEFSNGRFQVRIDNLSGKININLAKRPLLEMMVKTLDMSNDEKAALVDAILDWRDADDLQQLNGAESDYYESLAEPYKAKNGDFDSPEELMLVRGITAEIFYDHLRDAVTVFPKNEPPKPGEKKGDGGPNFDRININAAPPAVLRLMPDITETDIEAIRAFREESNFTFAGQLAEAVDGSIYATLSRYLTVETSPYYELLAEGRIRDSETVSKVRVLLRTDPKSEKGYRIVDWVENPDEWSLDYVRGRIEL